MPAAFLGLAPRETAGRASLSWPSVPTPRDDLGRQAPQPAVELRLAGQLREPAGQNPLDQTEELAIGGDADDRLGDGQGDQLLISGLRGGPERGIGSDAAKT